MFENNMGAPLCKKLIDKGKNFIVQNDFTKPPVLSNILKLGKAVKIQYQLTSIFSYSFPGIIFPDALALAHQLFKYPFLQNFLKAIASVFSAGISKEDSSKHLNFIVVIAQIFYRFYYPLLCVNE